ncbi:trehalose-6-phosphate synthase [Malonomonas rubra]|uniref:alpha,alpha-trehalose-phosphate synthase (UDP-forming) n=1 Tax=Malonomonas rubra TaxID=57040 RepID=UPI0026ECA8ED|nr:trehalose-6-phosphate synthase [Malonomonas rubra]
MVSQVDGSMIVVSNRLPLVVEKIGDEWQIGPAAGGLVTALEPVMRRVNGLWIGWPGSAAKAAPYAELFERFAEQHGYRLAGVPLTEEDVELYYQGFSNETIWPLFHDLLGRTKFELATWQRYQQVNEKFAVAIVDQLLDDQLIWVHDYQLALVGAQLRALGVRNRLAYFLHIPFPSFDLFRRLPWKKKMLDGLLQYDLLGFQTLRDRRNFVASVRELYPQVTADIRRRVTYLDFGNRQVTVGNFPISIDFEEFNQGARQQQVADEAWYLHEHYQGRQLFLGVDRLDYTKGISKRLLAFERALEKYPDLCRQATLIQVVVPSRAQVPEYISLKEELDRLVGRINARFSEHGWVPIHYLYRSLDRTQLLAHYRSCEIALISPLRDGMNLVAKEFCAASIEENGVLILSEFAGASAQLGQHALLVNPFDIEGTADTIWQAFSMDEEERRQRMRQLRSEVRRNNVDRWVEQFMIAVRPQLEDLY